MNWTCSHCGLSLSVSNYPIRCQCGWKDYGNGKTIPMRNHSKTEDVNTEEIKRREAICETCYHFTGIKCDLICKGCNAARKWEKAVRQGNCPDGQWTIKEQPMGKGHKWSYGITTVPQRVHDGLLQRTVQSLARAGFPHPVIYVDGPTEPPKWLQQHQVVVRPVNVNAMGNWLLSTLETYIREPNADYYAMFQDDIVAVRNLRQYLEHIKFPEKAYLNLYTFAQNDYLELHKDAKEPIVGCYPSNQKGKGATGLIMTHEGIRTILIAKHMIDRPSSSNKVRRQRAIDGGIVSGYIKAGWKEYVHHPSLIQHTGEESIIGNGKHKPAPTFPGEDFDALSLLKQKQHG